MRGQATRRRKRMHLLSNLVKSTTKDRKEWQKLKKKLEFIYLLLSRLLEEKECSEI